MPLNLKYRLNSGVLCLILLGGGLAAPACAQDESGAEEHSRRFPPVGPEVGFYFVSDGKAADAFGRTFTNIGIGLGTLQHARKGGSLSFDLNVVANRRSGSSVFLLPIGVAWKQSFTGDESSYWNPYFGGGVDVIPMQLQSDRYGLLSRFRTGVGASVFAGVNAGASAYLQVRYYLMNDVRGFNLSGTSLSVGYRF